MLVSRGPLKVFKIMKSCIIICNGYIKTHYGLVISGPRINGVPLGKESKHMEVPSGDKAAFGQYNTTISLTASSKGITPFGVIGRVPPCFPRPLKIEAVLGLRFTLRITRGNPGVQNLNPYPTSTNPYPWSRGKGLPRVQKLQPLPLPSVPYPLTPGGP
jgi:hypothetical protein